MDKSYIYNSIKFKYPELAHYLVLIVERQKNKLYRESFLYMRLAEEYIIEILAKQHKLSLMEKNNDIPNLHSYRTIYSFSEELYNKGHLTVKEKEAHDIVRKYANTALHRGTDVQFLEKIWLNCYENLFYVVSFLINEVDDYSTELTIYTEGDFIARMNDEFPDKMKNDDDFIEATNIFLKRINLNVLDVEKAKSIVDYYVQAIHGGTLPMLAVTYAIKMSQR